MEEIEIIELIEMFTGGDFKLVRSGENLLHFFCNGQKILICNHSAKTRLEIESEILEKKMQYR